MRPRPVQIARIALALSVLPAAAPGATGVPAVFDSEKAPGGPLSATLAAQRMELPPGFRATAFAAEPDVRQPIAMTTDPRGRLWVAENYTYSERGVDFHPELRDRIVILEDSDNDGRFDRRTVFWEGAQRLTSIEVGLGGVWALTLPNLVFIPDHNGDDVPDAEPRVELDGFDYLRARHNVANGLRWGPDGWLYGRHGILSTSQVGKPGTPAEQRTPVNVGIWRYHPQRGRFEVVASGTTNPWGMDWDAYGEGFFINTVIGHLWHLFPGAHYRRMFGDDPNRRTYELIDQHADHVHWATGEVWTDVRRGVTNATLAAGGGHAHVGLLVYQGGQWPEEWNGRLLTINFHGRRFNVEQLRRVGSGYVGVRAPDAFVFPDAWFRGIDLIAAPDGGVFVADWSDTGECHDNDGVSRSTGRIFKLGYGPAKPREPADLTGLSALQLARLQLSPNDWLARQARRVLADRAAAGIDLREGLAECVRIEMESTNPVHRLRALWARHVAAASDPARLERLLEDANENVRAWAVRLLADRRHENPDAFANLAARRLPQMAARDGSDLVRLTLASTLQMLPAEARVPLGSALLARAEDAQDHNVPLMLWYGIEPIAGLGGAQFERLVGAARIPTVLRLAARRLTEEIDTAPGRLDALLVAVAKGGTTESRRAVVEGMSAGLRGRRSAQPPPSWNVAQDGLRQDADAELRNRVRDLSAFFGDGRALDEIRALALDESADLEQRRTALRTLIDSRDPKARETCERVLRVRGLGAAAAAGLAQFDDPAIADLLLRSWAGMADADKAPVLSSLVSRPAWAGKVLDAISRGTLRRSDLSASHARQIRALNDAALTARLATVWADVRTQPLNERVLAQWRGKLTPDALARADAAQGRKFYQALCASCHKLNGEGGTIGPDLTGANRDSLEYLLENILFPSAVVADAYRQSVLRMKDGRTLAGVVTNRTGATLNLQTGSDALAIDAADVASEERSTLSLMPEGLLDAVGDAGARDLIAYLMTKDFSAVK